ncbi:hypothetical protein GE21DRAFT_1277335 [Neurospora crassa]|nr:hypothetical protein GE21DRAFT_1277335 [Neurospora crassa]
MKRAVTHLKVSVRWESIGNNEDQAGLKGYVRGRRAPDWLPSLPHTPQIFPVLPLGELFLSICCLVNEGYHLNGGYYSMTRINDILKLTDKPDGKSKIFVHFNGPKEFATHAVPATPIDDEFRECDLATR